MTALIVLGCILLALLLLSLVRVGGEAEYAEDGLTVRVRLGPLKLTVYPVKARPERRRPKKEKAKKPAPAPEAAAQPAEKPGGTLSLVRELLPLVAQAAGEMKRKIRIDLLVLHLTWAAGDPASAAMGFGAANAAVGMIYPLLDHNFKIRETDIGTAVDFDRDQPIVYLRAALSLTIGQGVSFAFYFGIKFLSVWVRRRKRPAAPEKKKEAVTHE